MKLNVGESKIASESCERERLVRTGYSGIIHGDQKIKRDDALGEIISGDTSARERSAISNFNQEESMTAVIRGNFSDVEIVPSQLFIK